MRWFVVKVIWSVIQTRGWEVSAAGGEGGAEVARGPDIHIPGRYMYERGT